MYLPLRLLRERSGMVFFPWSRWVFFTGGVAIGAVAGFLAAEFVTRASKPSDFESGTADPDSTTLVVVHSLTGRTALVGEELAAMFGARFIRVRMKFPGTGGDEAPEEESPVIQMDGVSRIFVGFPIWGKYPPAPVFEMVSRMDLEGRRVVPFFTYLHAFDPASLDRLKSLVVQRGGTWSEPIGLCLSLEMTPSKIRRALHQVVRGRTDLWAFEESYPLSCHPDESSRTVCRVTSGAVWLGDLGAQTGPNGDPPPRLVSVGEFEIDQAEATVEDYRGCVNAGACPPLIGLEQSFCGTLLQAGADVAIPCVSFEAAQAYCRWRGMRLPTEAEWIRAARGSTSRAFPWGDEPPSSRGPLRGNFGEKPGAGFSDYSTAPESGDWPSDGFPGLSQPCRFPAGRSPFGVCDLAGNVAEWVTLGHSEFGPPVLKGGSWLSATESSLAIGSRIALSLENPNVGIGFYLTGFRCVRPVR